MTGIIIAVLLVLGGYCFVSLRKMFRMNRDPAQHALAQFFINQSQYPKLYGDPRKAPAYGDPQQEAEAARQVGRFIASHGWDRVEATPRIAHALSMVKVMRPELYEIAVAISKHDEMWDRISGAKNPFPKEN